MFLQNKEKEAAASSGSENPIHAVCIILMDGFLHRQNFCLYGSLAERYLDDIAAFDLMAGLGRSAVDGYPAGAAGITCHGASFDQTRNF